MCCKVLGVEALNKPSMKWCDHCKLGVGCSIYSARPAECAAFYCDYLLRKDLDEKWYPAQSKIVLAYRKGAKALAVYVDPARKENWRKEPYYSQIRAWATALYPHQGQVVVWEGAEAIAVMPNAEKRLGPAQPGQKIAIFQKTTPNGKIYDAFLMDKETTVTPGAPPIIG
jgi:hypothetical protein